MRFQIRNVNIRELELLRELADNVIEVGEFDDRTFEILFECERNQENLEIIGDILLDNEYAEIDLSSLSEGILEIKLE